jgi:hypothetical protein
MLRTFLLASFLVLACSCAPSSNPTDGTQSSGSTDRPELSDEVIRERINEAGIWNVPNESGTGEPIYWNFDEDEPKEIVIVEKKVEDTNATIVLDIRTGSSARSRNKIYLTGQIRTEWELQTGWVLRRWEIVRTENISMKYRDLPKDPENTNKPVNLANPGS